MSNYYRIYFGEDHVSVENLTKEEVLEELNEYNENDFSSKMSIDLRKGESVDWPEKCECYKSVIIKGEVIIPQKVEVVTKYSVD